MYSLLYGNKDLFEPQLELIALFLSRVGALGPICRRPAGSSNTSSISADLVVREAARRVEKGGVQKRCGLQASDAVVHLLLISIR